MRDLRSRHDDGEPVLDLNDVCDLNEILIIRHTNELKARKAAERSSKK